MEKPTSNAGLQPHSPRGRDLPTETRARRAEAENMLRAIRHGEIDTLVVEGAGGHQVYTLHSAEEPYRNLVEQILPPIEALAGELGSDVPITKLLINLAKTQEQA